MYYNYEKIMDTSVFKNKIHDMFSIIYTYLKRMQFKYSTTL